MSVGIPFFNCEHCLLNSIRSIFAQTFHDWELILVDDGSTDKSLDIARSIDDPRIRVLPPDGENRRLAVRLNMLAKAAKGEFLARMDADDLSHPERLSKQIEYFNTHKEVDVLGTSMCILDRQNIPVNKLVVPEKHEIICKNKFKGISIAHGTVMARTEWFRRWPYDERYKRTQDYGLWVRSCCESVFANIEDVLYFVNEFISFAINKYASSKHTAAKVIWRYASAEIGRLRTTCYAGKRYIDIGVYTGAKLLGMHNLLISRRYHPLTAKEKMEVDAAIDIIRKTEVPIQSTE